MGKTYRREKSEGRGSRRAKRNSSDQIIKYKDEYLTELYEDETEDLIDPEGGYSRYEEGLLNRDGDIL